MLLLAAFSRHEGALQWALDMAQQQWGPVEFASDIFPFVDTNYYQQSMGDELLKTFWTFQQRIDPASLVQIKHQTNAWEEEYKWAHQCVEDRPLNLDPGYLTPAKLVLATTKDRDHRLYLGQGIYAEVTLHYRKGQGWQVKPWTYPDYQRPEYHAFFTRCRNQLRMRP